MPFFIHHILIEMQFQVASDLELTELQESSAEYQHQSGFQIYRPQTPAKK